MWKELSDPSILQRMGRRMRDYRIRMELTQGELAEKSGVSMGTIVRVEQGNPISTLLFISILRTMGLLENLEVLLPELNISPIQMRKMQGKKIQRIRHKKED
ncbi:MAG: helix-turn-helix domain-containing protein [Prevotella sp.]|nr:helix-turn-helix domain-containing protein [Prevotella sp.]